MLNEVKLIGNLGADPEIKTTAGGLAIANLRIATTSRIKRQDEWTDETEWHRCVCFGRTAENVGRFLTKGRQVYINGRIKTNKWTDSDGKDRYSTEVIVNEIKFLGSNGNGTSASPKNNGRQAKSAQKPEDDIPF